VNHSGYSQLLVVLFNELIEWARVGISWAVYTRLCGCLRATHDAINGGISLLATLIVEEISVLFITKGALINSILEIPE